MIDRQKNFILSSRHRAVGCTDASDACCSSIHQILTRNAEQLVSLVLERSCSSVPDIASSTIQLVRSLIIPVIARRSLRAVWFDNRELGRFISSCRKTAERIHQVVDPLSREQSYIKYWLGFYMCKIYQDPNEPVREDWMATPLFCGWLKRFVARRLAKRDISFFYSLDKGAKQSWPAMSKEKEAAVLEKHKERLGRQDEPVSDRYLRVLKLTVYEIFCEREPPAPTKFIPSGGACLQATVQNGGALSLYPMFRGPNPEDRATIGSLRSLTQALDSYRRSGYRFSKHVAESRLEEIVHPGIGGDYTASYPAALRVDIVPLAEPAKFRIISKGDGYLYTALQPLQGQMLGCWKNTKYSTMRDSDLTERVNHLDKDELPLWCSGDYEAATDLIRKHPSMEVLKQLSEDPAFPDALLGGCSFGYCRARYPDGSEIDSFESQLMGHVLSFPILCVLNLAAYRDAINSWVMDTDQRELGRRMWRNVIVNGDDILFKCTVDFVPYFYAATSAIGLKASVGKNYVSSDMCTINSQVFRRVDGVMKRYSYLNQRFIYGKGNFRKSSSDTDVTTPTQLSRGVNEMISFVPWTRCILPMTLKRFNKHLFKNLGSPNWYLPVHLGGYGFDPQFSAGAVFVNRRQRLLAAQFIHNPALSLYYMKGGVSLKLSQYYGAIAHTRWVVGDYVPTEGESFALEDEWLWRLAYCARLSDPNINKSVELGLKKFVLEHRLQPVGLRAIEKYFSVRLIANKLPICPPLNSLR